MAAADDDDDDDDDDNDDDNDDARCPKRFVPPPGSIRPSKILPTFKSGASNLRKWLATTVSYKFVKNEV